MVTLTTKNSELIDLINGLFNVQDLQGMRFGLVVSKNIRILQTELKDLEEASKASDAFVALSQKANSLDGDTEALELLEKENEELVKERRVQMEEMEKMMEDAVEVELHEILESLLPENITAALIINIDKLIKV